MPVRVMGGDTPARAGWQLIGWGVLLKGTPTRDESGHCFNPILLLLFERSSLISESYLTKKGQTSRYL